MSNTNRVKMCLSIPWIIPQSNKKTLSKGESFLDTVNNTRAVVMVGDNFYHDIYFPVEELEKSYLSLTNKPVKLNHTDDIEYEIGYSRDPQFHSGKISVQPVIVPETKHAGTALGWIKCRRDAGQAPEVSVEVWVTHDKGVVNDKEVTVARELEFDGFALVSRGACSPEAGCGIGMTMFAEGTDIYLNGEEWIPLEKIDLEKWDTKYINSLPNSAFAAVESCASEKKNARHLPHHNSSVKSATENSSVDVPHLRNALARVNQVQAVCPGTHIGELKKKALRHLIHHAKALDVGDYESLQTEIELANTILKDFLEEQNKMTKKEKEQKKLKEEPEEEEDEVEEEPEIDELRLSLEKEIEELKNKQNDCAKLNEKLVLERDELKSIIEEKTGEIETLTGRITELETNIKDLSKPRQKGLTGDTTRNSEESYYETMRDMVKRLRRNQ